MRKLILYFFLFKSISGEAQTNCSVSITGDTCTGNTLYAATSAQADTIIWYKNNIPIQATAPKSFDTIGRKITGGTATNIPTDIFIDKEGNIYVIDYYYCKVQEWKVGATSYITVAGKNQCGSGSGSLEGPSGVTVDSAGNIYVAEENAGGKVSKWAPGATQGIIVADDDLQYPNGVALDKNGNLFVLDLEVPAVFKYTPGSTKGVIVAGGNGTGSALNQLNYPKSLFVDDSDNVYIADYGNSRVVKWLPGAKKGTVVAGGNGSGFAINQLFVPDDIQVDKKGNIYISDYGRILMWAPGSSYGITVTRRTDDANAIDYGVPIFLDKNSNLYRYTNYVYKYDLSGNLDNSFKPQPLNYGNISDIYQVKCVFKNGCTDFSKTQIENQVPAYPYINGQDGGVCGLQALFYTGSAYGAVAYKWSNPPRTSILKGGHNSTVTLRIADSFYQGRLSLSAYNSCGYSEGYLALHARPSNVKIDGAVNTNAESVLTFHTNYLEKKVMYNWTVPEDVTILNGQGTDTLKVRWGNLPGAVFVTPTNDCGTAAKSGSKYISVKSSASQNDFSKSNFSTLKINSFQAYPQPAHDIVTLSFSSSNVTTCKIVITNASGMLLKEYSSLAYKGVNRQQINIGPFNSGLYYVKIKLANGENQNLKILKL
ncbi:MAG: T9SS type A sorting domain-containing protein [Parafilimonas sp.]